MISEELINKKLTTFRNDCVKQGITLLPKESSRLNAYFKNQLAAELGDDLENASFEDLIASMDGCGISPIEEYIEKSDNERETAQAEPAKESPKKETRAKAKKVLEKASADNLPAERKTSDPSKEKASKKEKPSGDQDFQSFFFDVENRPSSSESRELRKRIAALERDKLIGSRSIAIYHRDFALLSAVAKFGKRGRTPIELDGITIDSMTQVIHLATKLLAKELSTLKNEKLLKIVRDEQERITEEAAGVDEQIQELKKRLES